MAYSRLFVWIAVALRKESVDRNPVCYSSGHRQAHVALRKESVDRNTHTNKTNEVYIMSLSARRAWIEMG